MQAQAIIWAAYGHLKRTNHYQIINFINDILIWYVEMFF